jgi:hypothetical protein
LHTQYRKMYFAAINNDRTIANELSWTPLLAFVRACCLLEHMEKPGRREFVGDRRPVSPPTPPACPGGSHSRAGVSAADRRALPVYRPTIQRQSHVAIAIAVMLARTTMVHRAANWETNQRTL